MARTRHGRDVDATRSEPSDALIEAAAAGDRRALEGLLAALLPRIRNLVRYLVRGDDIDDITQDALIAVSRGLSTYRGDGAFSSWVNRVVARCVFASLRRERAVRALEDHQTSGDLLPVSTPSALEGYQNRRAAVRLLDALPDEQRHAVVLHHVLEMTVPEIASELNVAVETVRSRLRLARGRIAAAAEPDSQSVEREGG